MKYNSKGRFLALLPAVVLLIVLAWPVRVLVLESEHRAPLLLAINSEDTVTLQYVHSIYHVRQREVYQPARDGLVLRSMYFGDMSAALYYDDYRRYRLEPEPGGGYTIKELNLHYPAVSFALGHGTEYEMYVGTALAIDFNRAFPDATFLTIRTATMPVGEFILGRLRNGSR